MHRRRLASIPLADRSGFESAERRTLLMRWGGLLALVITALAVLWAAPTTDRKPFLPAGTVGIVVLDLSSSIRPSTFELVHDELARHAASRQRFGLVLFSDVAYEALPPGTPARELGRFVRFFVPRAEAYDKNGNLVAHTPWEQWFSAGTSISSGLLLAADLLERLHVRNGSVELISDLADDPSDRESVADAILSYAQRGIPLTITAIEPTSEDRKFFQDVIGSHASIREVRHAAGASGGEIRSSGSVPTRMLSLGAILTALLAVGVFWIRPFDWRRAGR
jgi:hypothetical protein